MTHRKYINSISMWFLMATVSICLSSCYDSLKYNQPDCDYNVQLRYDYNEENTTTENRIEYYVHTIDEYIFNEQGTLIQHRRFKHGDSKEMMHSNLMLPPGRYSVIAIGNKDDRSVINEANPFATKRDDVLLSLKNSEQMPDNTFGNSERLYHGYETFTVKSQDISHIRVDMVNSHLNLKFRITWKNNTTPARGDYYVHLESVPSEYSLMPEWIYPTATLTPSKYNPFVHDTHLTRNDNAVHHIPTVHQDRNILKHRIDTKINVDNEMWGEFISYRIKSTTKPILRIYNNTNLLIMSIELSDYFDWYGHSLDTELKQEYALDILVDGNNALITPMDIADWEEGGILKN